MQNRERLEQYRQMTNAERFRIAMKMTEEHFQSLLSGPPEEFASFFKKLRRENDEECQALLEGLALAETHRLTRGTQT